MQIVLLSQHPAARIWCRGCRRNGHWRLSERRPCWTRQHNQRNVQCKCDSWDTRVGGTRYRFQERIECHLHVLPCRKSKQPSSREVFLHPGNFFSCFSRNSWFEHFSLLFCNQLVRFTFSLSASPKNTWSRNDVGSSRSIFLVNFFHMGAMFCFSPAIMMSSTHTDKNNPCFRWTNIHSQFGTFSHPSSNRGSSNCLSHNNPANGCPCKFRPRGTTRSSMFAHDLDHLCRRRRIQTSGHSDFGILSNLEGSSWVYADW